MHLQTLIEPQTLWNIYFVYKHQKLARKTLDNLLRIDPDHFDEENKFQLPIEAPCLSYAYLKHLWNDGDKVLFDCVLFIE